MAYQPHKLEDYFVNVALGLVDGVSHNNKFGRNDAVDTTSTPEDVWDGGGLYTGHPTSFTPETVDVFSSDTNDTSAGTGARTFRIFGLKTSSSTAYEYEDITLNGTTAVTSTSTWWRVNRGYVLTAGTGGTNAGTITVRSTTTTANVFMVLYAGFAQSQVAAWTVPAGTTALIHRLRASIARDNAAAGTATLSLRVREPGGVYRAAQVTEVATGTIIEATAVCPISIPAGSDILVRVDAVTANATHVDVSFELILVT